MFCFLYHKHNLLQIFQMFSFYVYYFTKEAVEIKSSFIYAQNVENINIKVK